MKVTTITTSVSQDEISNKAKWKRFSQGWIDTVKRRYQSEVDFFPYNPNYTVPGRVLPYGGELSMFPLEVSTGGERPMKIYGTFHGVKMFKHIFLTIYEMGGELFIPFSDAHDQTYKGGRYLDLEKPKGDLLVIDFNFAYNPLCLYSEKYSCPIPPPENRLKIRIPAGMRKTSYPKGIARFLRSLI